MLLRSLITALAVAFSFGASAAPTTAPATLPTGYMTAVWSQPSWTFQTWRARGVTTLIRAEPEGGTVTLAEWKARAKAAGLRYVLQSDVVTAADDADPALVAVMLAPDEPDGANPATPDQVAATAAAVRKLCPHKPTAINFDGGKVQDPKLMAAHVAYAASADILFFDSYPYNFAQPNTNQIAACLDLLTPLGKPVVVFLETSDQDMRVQAWLHSPENQPLGEQMAAAMRGPTGDEFAQMAGLAIAHGAAGLAYFPDQIGNGWEGFDGTPDDVALAMTRVNAALTPVVAPVAVTVSPSVLPATAPAKPATLPVTKPATAPAKPAPAALPPGTYHITGTIDGTLTITH